MNPEQEIGWFGDLNDDCIARWNGLTLRAEEMERRRWWWAVYDENGDTIDDSNEYYPKEFRNGIWARSEAEKVAREYLEKLASRSDK
ncbi:hypothetical protein [Aliikangiella coralliicola]|uniref:Uncharacterized protein n=1 Tax=Aliikangiella coralliicola TaxID=2592383 RepID=A0A545UCE5_9GAMM|nr:hypothetical protein [Aliikangiella coralliicola]TQV87142.1 hypothetical protein FLL46_15160 [Aliikangiella coralliicola]